MSERRGALLRPIRRNAKNVTRWDWNVGGETRDFAWIAWPERIYAGNGKVYPTRAEAAQNVNA